MEHPRTTRGYYVGTRVDGSWWRRYRGFGWLTRGNSEIWVEADGLCFRLYLTRAVRRIPALAMADVAVEEGSWHRGTFTGTPAVRIAWSDGQHALVTWLCVSHDLAETQTWAEALAQCPRISEPAAPAR